MPLCMTNIIKKCQLYSGRLDDAIESPIFLRNPRSRKQHTRKKHLCERQFLIGREVASGFEPTPVEDKSATHFRPPVVTSRPHNFPEPISSVSLHQWDASRRLLSKIELTQNRKRASSTTAGAVTGHSRAVSKGAQA